MIGPIPNDLLFEIMDVEGQEPEAEEEIEQKAMPP